MQWEPIILRTVPEISNALARRARELRLLKGYKRQTIAERADISPASLKRFETTGKISLESLLKLANALGRLGEFDGLLKLPKAKTIDELTKRSTMAIPKRGRR